MDVGESWKRGIRILKMACLNAYCNTFSADCIGQLGGFVVSALQVGQ
jgi:hypothetical protein